MKFSVFQMSDAGGRPRNEDRMGYCYTSESALFLVADGMGGHAAGDVAAQMCLQTMSAYYQQHARPQVRDPERFLVNALMAAHDELARYTERKALPDAPRTTVVAVLVQNGMAHWLHCGDSRAYWVRQGSLLSRTRDHSYAERSANAPAAAHLNPHNRNVLFTCVGGPEKPHYDVSLNLKLARGDKMLLCSDGLWDSLSEAQIVSMLASQKVAQTVPLLVRQAVVSAEGPSDNVTVVAFEWEMPDPEQAKPVKLQNTSLTTDALRDGVFASTIQNNSSATGDDNWDELSLEQSIQEINAAIARTRKSP
jgi:PPM family protein phosphatase